MIPGQFLTPALVHRNVAQGLNTYDRASPPYHAGSDTAANRRTLIIPAMRVNIGGLGYYIDEETERDLNDADTWDTLSTDYTAPITRAGRSFFLYACRPVKGRVPVFKVSDSSSAPSGYNTSTSKKICGYDCLPYVTAPVWVALTARSLNYVSQPTTPDPVNRYLYKVTTAGTSGNAEPAWPTTPGATVVSGTITYTCMSNACMNLDASHPYKNHEMGSIIFNSIWDRWDRPSSDLPQGMVKNSLTPWDGVKKQWIDIYLASGTGSTCTSVFNSTIKDTVDWYSFVEYGRLQGKRLLRAHEFQNAAYGSNEETNIAGSADPVSCTFSLDTAGKSMISYIGAIMMCGGIYQWGLGGGYRFDGATAHSHQVTVSGEAQTVTSGNASADVAPAFSWYDLPGAKGSLYKQGTYGYTEPLFGGDWNYGTNCGSRSRFLAYWPWYTYSSIGGRFLAEPA